MAGEILFHKSVVEVFLEFFQRTKFAEDPNILLEFLILIKFIARECKYFTESEKLKKQIKAFLKEHYNVFLKEENKDIAKQLLNELLSLSVGLDFNISNTEQINIKHIFTFRIYYRILYLSFKQFPIRSMEGLCNHLTAPLKKTSQSLYNMTIIAQVNIVNRSY